MELSVITTGFLTDREQRGCNARTVAYYADLLRWLSGFLSERGLTDSDALTTAHLETYFADLRERKLQFRKGHLSPVTIRNWTLSYKTFFAWACGHGYTTSDLARPIPVPKKRTLLPKALSPEQARKLLSAQMHLRERAIISLMLDSGVRIGECSNLNLADLDNDLCTVMIREGKRDRQRVAVFAEATREALRAWLGERDRLGGVALFVTKTGKRLAPASIYKLVKATADSVGLEQEVSPHRLRHSFATFYLDGGGAIQDLAVLMGHDDIATTTIYNAVSNRTLRRKHRQFSPLNALNNDLDW